MTPDYTHLRKLIAGATAGEWRLEDYRGEDTKDWRSTGHIWAGGGDFHPGKLVCVVDCNDLHSESGKDILEFESNAAYICAISPEVLTAILDERDKLLERVKDAENVLGFIAQHLPLEPRPGDKVSAETKAAQRYFRRHPQPRHKEHRE